MLIVSPRSKTCITFLQSCQRKYIHHSSLFIHASTFTSPRKSPGRIDPFIFMPLPPYLLWHSMGELNSIEARLLSGLTPRPLLEHLHRTTRRPASWKISSCTIRPSLSESQTGTCGSLREISRFSARFQSTRNHHSTSHLIQNRDPRNHQMQCHPARPPFLHPI